MVPLNSSGLQTHYVNYFETKKTLNWGQFQTGSSTQMRLKVVISQKYQNEPVISRLILDYGLIVNITGANLVKDSSEGWFDLELRGNIQQLQKALAYFQQLEFKISGKANPDGDGW